MSQSWILTPADTALSDGSGWANLGGNRYAAVRHYLLVVSGTTGKVVNGPIVRQMDWPVRAKFRIEEKNTSIVKYTYTIQESITSAVTVKLSRELLTKVAASLAINPSNLQSTLSSELQSKINSELVESIQDMLSTVQSYEVQVVREQTESLEVVVPDRTEAETIRTVFTHLKLRQRFWDIYLHSSEYLQLEYKKNWLWPDVRKTIIYELLRVRAPLFRINFWEPEDVLSFKYDTYEPEVSDGRLIECVALDSKCPGATPDLITNVQDLARLAFPASRKEKEEATRSRQRKYARRPRRSTKAAAKKATAKKAAAKKATAKKATAKKATAKKAMA